MKTQRIAAVVVLLALLGGIGGALWWLHLEDVRATANLTISMPRGTSGPLSDTVAAPAAKAAAPAPVSAAPPPPGSTKALTGPGNLFVDEEFKIQARLPEGWNVRSSGRWGQRQNTVLFEPDGGRGIPSLYYNIWDQPMKLQGAQIDAWLREQAPGKERGRIAAGMIDYRNDPAMTSRIINGRPALTWTAQFTRDGDAWSEYLTRIYSPAGTVLFFMMAPKSEMPKLIPKYEVMIQSTTVP